MSSRPSFYEPWLYPPSYIKLTLRVKRENGMAEFDKAFNNTMGHEGGYSNDPDDAGGETYRGISRKYHPNWEGWVIIDDTKPNIDSAVLDPYVRSFYKNFYWNPNRLDEFPQEVSDEIFDTGVNMGVKEAAKFFQRSLNYLNRNSTLYPDLVDDGLIGGKTISAFSSLPKQDLVILLTMMNVLQGQHYMEYMTKSPTQEKYARGWFNRVMITKN